MSYRVERHFNLLILEEGEEYVADVSATMALVRHGQAAQSKGRLRICSKCLVFQPEDVSASILKFPYRYIRSIGDEEGPGFGFPVECEQFVQVATQAGAETRVVTAFTVRKTKRAVNFQVHYAEAAEYVQLARRLRDAAALKAGQAEQVVRGILAEVTADVQFDMSRLSHREAALLPSHTWVRRVKPLLEVRGMLQISDEAVYFQPHPNFSTEPVKRIAHADIAHVFRRVYGLQANAVEIIIASGSCLYLCFEDQGQCDVALSILQAQRRRGDAASEPSAGPLGDAEAVVRDVRRMTALWQSGLLSNFHYVDFLNCAAGRSRNDFSQYPVFPWVLRDYQSDVVQLKEAFSYRDLSKPVGALSPKRLAYFKERMEGMSQEERFLYGTHYSTPAYVIHWLLRQMPERMLRMHNGHFDSLPRLFRSVLESWETVNEGSASLMELIPEFFVLPAPWLENELGITTPEGVLADVILPRWARGKDDFICKMRAALESEYVSRHLPGWIDLIFGFKQRGEEAVRADNLFHPVCYTEAGGQGQALSGLARTVLETQLQEFGRMPRQLFSEPHPPRLKIPQWSTERLLRDPAQSQPWYTVVLSLAAGGDKEALVAAAAGAAQAPAPPASGASALAAALPRAPAAVSALTPATSATMRALSARAVAPVVATGQITGVGCCSSNMYCVGEDGCLRISPLGCVDDPSDLSTTCSRRSFRISPMPLSALAVLATDMLAIGGHDNSVTLYSSSRGSSLSKAQVHADTVTCIGVSPCKNVLVSGSRDQSVRTWSFSNASLRNEETFDDLQRPVECCAVAGNLVLAGAADGQLVAWDTRSGIPVLDRELGGRVVACALQESERAAVALDETGDIRLWDFRRQCESFRLSVRAGSGSGSLLATCCFVTDFAEYVLVGGSGLGGFPAVALWDIPEQRELRTWALGDTASEVKFMVPGSGIPYSLLTVTAAGATHLFGGA